jgi:transcriptional regulator with XRE-family HTH domain
VLSGNEAGSTKAIGRRLQALQAHLKLTGRAFCDLTGIQANRFSQWKSGTHPPSIDGAIAIRRKWGVTLDWIYFGSPSGMPGDLLAELMAIERALDGDERPAPKRRPRARKNPLRRASYP